MPALENICVGDHMHRGVITCAPDTPLPSVARTMAEERIHGVFVSGQWAHPGYDELVWGVVFDMDVVRVAGGGIEGKQVGDLAHQDVRTVRPEVPLTEAIALMAQDGFSHLIVVDGPLEPVGILSSLDVMRALVSTR